ncbi:MAG: alanine--tRNA ligase [Gammaproteobacteria bacterium]|nr:alanine--tRNA ligase [Gammaproteobacteria bacterium]
MMQTAEIRQRFLEYFERNGHTIVPSSPLVPGNDATLLFTNAGMVQFKDVFTGRENRPYVRATSVQRCVRAGGKHNDLENVGYTARHHTFFEMLGNFSFGDYFKRDAIRFAWEFLTGDMGLPPEKLWVTVYESDDEAVDLWLNEIGLPEERLTRIAGDDNFWSMADTGPCGPCTEIFYDHGPDVAGGPPGSAEQDGDRYVEIWNLVFMQFDRDAQGQLNPLPRPSVDTGMGLERLATVIQGVHSNYDTDHFRRLIAGAAKVLGVRAEGQKGLNVIADHIRSCAFLVTDGVVPSNEGRGYVLRRIIRRAARYGNRLGASEPFFHKLVGLLVEEMGAAYPELVAARERVEQVLRQEEIRFGETLSQGLRILEQEVAELDGKEIPGEVVFRLYDTFGFPVDLTADIAREQGLTLDMRGYEDEMSHQRRRAREASRFGNQQDADLEIAVATEFTGYERVRDEGRVIELFRDGRPVETLSAGESGIVVLDHTPFYAESGGQVGDRGSLRGKDGSFEVNDTRKIGQQAIGHVGVVRMGQIAKETSLRAEVDAESRAATAANHSVTHLLHAALRRVLGEHVQQKGSLVDAGHLRFDFSHDQAVADDQLRKIEALVNREIRANSEVGTRIMGFDEARAAGAVALFGEKYGERVRVVGMGEFSTELCGGTHVSRTGDIGLFRISSEGGVAAGVRRIEAVSGAAAVERMRNEQDWIRASAAALKANPEDLVERAMQASQRIRELEKEIERLKGKLSTRTSGDLADQAQAVADTRVLAARIDGADAKTLRTAVDRVRDKLGSVVVVLGSVVEDKVVLVAGVTADLTDRVHAGKLVGAVAKRVGGRGGGRPDMAQAGGSDPAALAAALEAVPAQVAELLGSG